MADTKRKPATNGDGGGEETEKLGENEAGGLKWQPKAGTSLFRVTLQ